MEEYDHDDSMKTLNEMIEIARYFKNDPNYSVKLHINYENEDGLKQKVENKETDRKLKNIKRQGNQ